MDWDNVGGGVLELNRFNYSNIIAGPYSIQAYERWTTLSRDHLSDAVGLCSSASYAQPPKQLAEAWPMSTDLISPVTAFELQRDHRMVCRS